MSATEKLKALDEAATPVEAGWTVSALTHIYGDRGDGVRDVLIAQSNWRREDADLVVVLRNVLPELIAVVKAAEEGFMQVRNEHGVVIANGWVHAIPTLRTALAALDAKLGKSA